jgi:hypothetical protein
MPQQITSLFNLLHTAVNNDSCYFNSKIWIEIPDTSLPRYAHYAHCCLFNTTEHKFEAGSTYSRKYSRRYKRKPHNNSVNCISYILRIYITQGDVQLQIHTQYPRLDQQGQPDSWLGCQPIRELRRHIGKYGASKPTIPQANELFRNCSAICTRAFIKHRQPWHRMKNDK